MNFGTSHHSLYHFYFKKKKYQQCHCQAPEDEELQIIELKKGHVTFRRDYSANMFRTHDYTKVDFLVKLLFRIISLNGNLFFLAISIIQLAVDTLSPFLTWIHISPLVFYGLSKALKEIYFDIKKNKFDNSFNRSKTRRLSPKTGEKVEEIYWEDIEVDSNGFYNVKVGDIIVLFENDYAPCDMILLDTSLPLNKENVAYVSTKLINGKKNLITKKCPKITAFGSGASNPTNFQDYCKNLSGKIEYDNPNIDMETFHGIISLHKDPKAEILSNSNFIMQLSKLKNVKWAIGIAVYTGKHTKITMNSDYHIRKPNFALVFANKFNYLMILIVTLLAVISTVVFLGRSEVLEYLSEYESYIDNSIKFFFFMIQYANFVPLAIYFVIDIIEIIHYRKSKFILSKGVRRHFINTYNPSALANLGLIDYIIFDQNVLNLKNKLKVKHVYVEKRLYTIKQDELLTKVLNMMEKHQEQIEFNSKQDMDMDKTIPEEPEMNVLKSKAFDGGKNFNKEKEKPLKHVGFKDFPADYSETTTFKPEAISRIYSRNDEERDHEYLKFGLSIKQTMKELDSMPDNNFNSDYIEQLGIDDFVKDIYERDIDDLMKAILLCSEAKCIKTDKLNDKVISNFQEEKALLGLAKNLQCTIESKSKLQDSKIRLKIRNSILDYIIIGTSESQEKSGKFASVVCPLRKNGTAAIEKTYLYVKGPYDQMRRLITLDQEKAILLDIAAGKISKFGTVPYIFAKRRLTGEQTKVFAKTYKNVKSNLTLQEDSIDKMFIELEQDLELVGMCGVEQQCFSNTQDTLKLLEQSGVNRWVVSNDTLEKMLVPLSAYSLFNLDGYNFYIHAETLDSVAHQIKSHMHQFQRIYESEKRIQGRGETNDLQGRLAAYYKELSDSILKRMKEYSILISGKSMELISHDAATYEHFAFLCALSGRVIGFNFTPENKKQLVTLIKEKFDKSTYVMTVGTNFSDMSMCHASDVGIICTNFKNNQRLMAPWGDIQVSDLSKVASLLLKKGISFTHQLDHTLYYLFYKSIAISLPLFYFNWFSTMTGTSIYDSVLLFLLFFLFTTLPLISFSFEKPFSSAYPLMYPALYGESRYKKSHMLKKFILRSVIEGVFHSTWIFYIGLYHVGRSVSSDGLTTDLVMVSLFFVISLVFVINFKIFLSFSKNSLIFWAGVIWSLTFLFGFIWINVSASFTETMFTGLDYQLDELVGRLSTLFCFFLVIPSCLGFSYVINHYVIFKEVASAWDRLAHKFKTGKIEELNNKNILDILTHRKNIDKIVKTIYKKTSQLDSFIFEMLAMMGGAVSSIGLNRFSLKFRDKTLERRYKASKEGQNLVLTKAIYYTGTVFFIIWSIVISVSERKFSFAFSRFIICCVLVGYCFFINSRRYSRNFSIWNFLFASAVVATKLTFDFIRKDDGSLATALMTMVMSAFLSLELVHSIILNVVLLTVFYVRQGTNYGQEPDQQSFYILISNYLLLTSISVISIYLGAQLEKQKRIEFMAYMKIDSQSTSYNNVLSLLVPNFVKDLLNRGIRFLAEDQGKVAILFCDICDFDKVMTEKGPAIVKLLDALWRQFDRFCSEQGLQKIETVGKTYMACGGLKSTEREYMDKVNKMNPTRRVVNMAMDMMSFVEESVFDDDCNLTIKIGINYGRAIAGILGHHKPQFSLIGDTVNTTSRCCSTGLDGKITLSESAYEQVAKDGLRFEKRMVEAKGKGEIATYILRRETHNRAIRKVPEHQGVDKIRSLMTVSLHGSEMRNSMVDIKPDDILGEQPAPKEQATPKLNIVVGGNDKKKRRKREKIVDYNPEVNDDDIESRTIQLKPSRWLLRLDNLPVKKQFNHERDKKYYKLYYIALFFLASVYLIQSMLILIVRKLFGFPSGFIALRGTFSVMLVLLILLGKYFEKRKVLNRVLLYICLMYGCVLVAVQSQYTSVKSIWFHRISMLELVVVLIIGINTRKFKFIQSVIFYVVYTIFWLILYAFNPNIDYEYVFYYFIFAFYIAINHYLTEYNEIKRFNIGLKQNQKNFEQDNLVSQLLPMHAIDKLLRAKKLVTEDSVDEINNATILFADIAGFTKYSSSVEPEEVVKMLSELFTEFDQMCVKLKIYKVYTIGDCYVALGFVNKEDRNPGREADNIIQMGIAMIRIIQQVKESINHPGLNMRIGVHTGKIIGGIIGTEVVRYDLYGSDVLVANKMESNGKEGMIHVSETTKSLLEKCYPEKYRFEKHATVNVKSLNKAYEGYLVYYQDNDPSSTLEEIPFRDTYN